jgi:hypothetical protein
VKNVTGEKFVNHSSFIWKVEWDGEHVEKARCSSSKQVWVMFEVKHARHLGKWYSRKIPATWKYFEYKEHVSLNS